MPTSEVSEVPERGRRWLIVPVCAQGAANVGAFRGQFSAVALQEVEVDQHAAWTAERKWAGWMRQAEAASETGALLVLLGAFPQEVFQPLVEQEEWARSPFSGLRLWVPVRRACALLFLLLWLCALVPQGAFAPPHSRPDTRPIFLVVLWLTSALRSQN